MGKAKTIYICSNCAAEFSQWFGKCSNCDTYDSLVEQNITAFIGDIPSRGGVGNWHATQGHGKSNTKPAKARSSLTFDQISDRQIARWESGYGELDRVLGGGVVPGSMVLIGGDPGIGKSTLLLQVSNQLAQKYRILYVTGEESGQQVKLRASRLGMSQPPTVVTEDDNNKDPEKPVDPDSIGANLYILPETDLEEILREIDSLKPNVVVIDSIQTVFFPALTSAPGSVAQVRECTAGLMKVAKHEDITMLIVGHVTKEGAIAGPKVLEHLVDTVLYFEGDRFASHRLLRL